MQCSEAEVRRSAVRGFQLLVRWQQVDRHLTRVRWVVKVLGSGVELSVGAMAEGGMGRGRKQFC